MLATIVVNSNSPAFKNIGIIRNIVSFLDEIPDVDETLIGLVLSLFYLRPCSLLISLRLCFEIRSFGDSTANNYDVVSVFS